MSDSNETSAPERRRGGLLARLKARLGGAPEATLRESLDRAMETHAAQNPGETIKEDAKSMMVNLIEFADLRVGDTMVPRADIVAIEDSASVRDLLERFVDANHSRLPVYRETLDDLTGLIHVKDLLGWMAARSRGKHKRKTAAPGFSVAAADLAIPVRQLNIQRELLFVPPSMPAADLLLKMRASRVHMAVVVDEYGGTDGLVSIEDLVEEIVGDISDEHDVDEQAVKQTGEGVYVADARVDLDELEALLGVRLLPDSEEDADTLGGLIFAMLGRVPTRGELVRHPTGLEFEILDGDPRRVKRVRIHSSVKTEKPAGEDSQTSS
jgi:CBS domain containing-hemolysin-like protein